MALATLNAKKLARVSQLLAVDLADSFLNGLIYSPLNAGTYYDAAARVQGSGSAVTVSREQILGLTRSVYWTPNRSGVGGVLNNRGIVAMDIAAATPTMANTAASVDSFATNTLLASVHKTPGAYNTWAAANPFTSGDFHGYYRASFGAALAQTWSADVYESQESVVIALNNNAGATVLGLMLGAVLDPLSTHASAAESDGRLYGVCVSGGTVAIPSDYWFSSKFAAVDAFLDNDANANNRHHTVFTPGAGTLTQVGKLYRVSTEQALFDGNMTGLGGTVFGGFGIPFGRVTAPYRFMGVLRQIGVSSRYPAGTVLQSGGIDTAYVCFSDSWSANGATTILAV
jgi:hypothetical protein